MPLGSRPGRIESSTQMDNTLEIGHGPLGPTIIIIQNVWTKRKLKNYYWLYRAHIHMNGLK